MATDFISMDDFEPDNIKAEIMVEGRRRVVDFGNMGRFRASFDVTSDIEMGKDGYPDFDSIDEVAQGLVADIAASMQIAK